MAEHYHLVGVAGVGMSALAQVLLACGHEVSGSDRGLDAAGMAPRAAGGEALDTLDKLRAAGVQLCPQDGTGVRAGSTAVVTSTAIERNNPDVAAAARLGVPLVHRAAMLARLAAGKPCVAVTGTSGKSTVTGMIGWMLERLGADPVVVNGAAVLNWRHEQNIGNVRYGAGPLWVLEADESDRSLLEFHPDWAVVTNVSADHFDPAETRSLFRQFVGQVKHGGVLDAVDNTAWLSGFEPTLGRESCDFTHAQTRFHVGLPGRHNAENALCAVRLCERLGYEPSDLAEALAEFRGLHRRLEAVGTAHGVRVIDDYAHNPAKLEAAWTAVAPYHRRVIGIWRPHGYGPLATMLEPLTHLFRNVCRPPHRLFVLPVYDAGGTAERTVQSEMLVKAVGEGGGQAACAIDYADLLRVVPSLAEAGDAVLVMGARDPDLPVLARRLLDAINDDARLT